MDAMINGRTPEAIKDKILWCCSAMCCGECKYDADGDFCSSDTVLKDALALIERLESERDAALAKVRDTPAVDAVPVVHARWISEVVTKCDWKGRTKQYYQPRSCSVCHEPAIQEYNYCPNCGAKMDA